MLPGALRPLKFSKLFHEKLSEYRAFRQQLLLPEAANQAQNVKGRKEVPILLIKFGHLMSIRQMQMELEELSVMAKIEKEERAIQIKNSAADGREEGTGEQPGAGAADLKEDGVTRALRQLKEWNREKQLRMNPPYRRMRVFKEQDGE